MYYRRRRRASMTARAASGIAMPSRSGMLESIARACVGALDGAAVGGNAVCVTAGARVGTGVGVAAAGTLVAVAEGGAGEMAVPVAALTRICCPAVKMDVGLRWFSWTRSS